MSASRAKKSASVSIWFIILLGLKNYGNWFLLPDQFQRRFKEQMVSSPKGPTKAKDAKVVNKTQPVGRDDASSANATPQLGPSHDLDIKERIEKIKQEQKMERMAEI
jgi:hypothetical protein